MLEPTALLRPSDPAWDAWILRAPHDFYHLAAYHEFSESVGEGRAYMVVHGSPERFVAWPYLAKIEGNLNDANSVYGYTGPIGLGLEDATFREQAWRGFCAVWADQRLVSLFTRFHPMLENWIHCEGFHGEDTVPGGEIFHIGRSVSIDLGYDRDARRLLYPQVLRQEIKESERSGLVVEQDPDWSSYEALARLYRATMQKNDASDRYIFSDEYFEGLRRALGHHGHLAFAHLNGEPAAVLLYTVCNEIAEAHLTGINSEFQALSPLKALIDGVADFARSHGANHLHLGAGRGGHEDSLFSFKARFSPVRHEFKLGRWILNKDTYDALTLEHSGQSKTQLDYFPAYKLPPTTGAADK